MEMGNGMTNYCITGKVVAPQTQNSTAALSTQKQRCYFLLLLFFFLPKKEHLDCHESREAVRGQARAARHMAR
jgi:hypothetical protein